MKRELAALETESSPVLDSSGRKTRSSKQQVGCSDSNGVFERLVYKRVRRTSSQTKQQVVDLGQENRSNGVLQVGSGENEGKEREIVVTEVVKPSSDDRVEEANKEKEGVKDVSDPVLMEVEVEVEELTKELPLKENSKEVNVQNDDREVNDNNNNNNNALMEGEGGDPMIVNEVNDGGVNEREQGEEGVTLVNKNNNNSLMEGEGGDPVIVNEVNDGGVNEREQGEEGVTLVQSSSTRVSGVKGKKKSSSERVLPRRFTRSALKCKDPVVQSEENVEVGKGEGLLKTQVSESDGELKKGETPKRVTRSSLKSKIDDVESGLMEASDSVITDKENNEPVMSDENENVNAEADITDKDVGESISATPKRKMEMKMSKQIALAKFPTNVKELLETGLLEGCPVYYDAGQGPLLRGRFRSLGILCSCGLCQDRKVIPPSLFEIHARNSYKRAVQYIYLDNGRSLIQILKACRSTRGATLETTIQNAIGPVPEKKLVVCQNCKEPFSTMDADSSEAVCSSCIMSNVSPIGPVFSFRRLCSSSKSVGHSKLSQAAPARNLLPDRSHERTIEKFPEALLTPKVRSSPRLGKPSETKITEKKANNSQELSGVPKTCSSPPMGKSPEPKTCQKLKKKSFKGSLSPKLAGSTGHMKKSAPGNDHGKITKRSKKEVLTPKPSKIPSVRSSSEKKTSGKITRKDLRLHKLVFEDDVLPDGTELGYYARGQLLLDGYKKGSGIFCNCCDTVISASQFEAHAGCASRRKPYCYIYTSNGVSLHELSINLIKGRTHSTKDNDDLCSICADGGNLLLCDGCPRAFHTECASLSTIPRGKWYCQYCQNMFEREKFVAHNANAVAAGRISGVDPIEQITTRSIRIVSNVASEMSSCILCRGFDFSKSGFGPRTIILCDQCEKEYHVGCLKDHNMADLTELPEGKWFCCMDCGRIESALQNLLVRGAEKLPESLVNVIQKKIVEQGSECATDVDVSWRLLSGKIASPEIRPLLSQAVAIFHESFAPIMDVVSGNDLIPAMVYGRNVAGQEYGGMYCAVLTINSVVVSAGIFRIFGPEVAELPLVATSAGNQGKGYFQALFACIERLLAFLKVKSLVLPAAEEAESIWTDRFGFTKMTLDELREFKRNYWSAVRFQGTSMLHKPVPECRIVESKAEQ